MELQSEDVGKKLKDYMTEWSADAEFEISDLANESRKTIKLHSKFLVYMTNERLRLKKLDIEREVFIHKKSEWIQGRLSLDELSDLGWSVRIGPKILRPDIDQYVNVEPEVIKKNLQFALQKEKVDFLVSVLDQIKQRGYLIKSALDWQRFTNGA